MKKWLSLILAVIMTLSLAACASSTPANETAEPSETQPAATEPVTVEPTETEPAVTEPTTPAASLAADALADGYFKVIGSLHEGVSGYLLHKAQIAFNVVNFAAANAEAINASDFRDTLLAAWNSLSQEEQSDFDANFMNIVTMIDEYNASYQTHQGEFEDAGVSDEMQALLEEQTTNEAWSKLRDNTVTLGNSSGE